MFKEGTDGYASEVQGNPQYTGDIQEESADLLKVQLKQRVETLEDDLADAEKRVVEAGTDELIDNSAAEQLVEDIKGELEEAREEYEQKFGKETIN